MKESAKDIWARLRAGQAPDTATCEELNKLADGWDMKRYVTYRDNRNLYDGLSAAECLEIFSNNQREVTPTKLTNSQLTVARSEWAMMLKTRVAAQKVKDTATGVSVVVEHDVED